MSTASESIEKKPILFENGQSAELLRIGQAANALDVFQGLNLPESQAAIIIGGGAQPFNPRLRNRLVDLFSRGLVPAALECEAILIDEGTNRGVSELVGQGVADRGRKTKLVGVVPPLQTADSQRSVMDERAELDANHTHFLLNEQNGAGQQAETMCRLAELASKNKDWILTILAGGEPEGTALELALQTVRRGWHLMVVEGSGALADEISRLKKEALAVERRTGGFWRRVNPFRPGSRLKRLRETNPRLYEIISDGKILIIGPSFDAIQVRNLIKGLFTHPPKENILWTAWQRFAEFDYNSTRHRRLWHRLKKFPLYMSVVTTLLVLLYEASAPANVTGQPAIWADGYNSFMSRLATIRSYRVTDLLFRFLIILIPIASSLILAAETRLKLGSKYILLRGAAEAVKRGIYSFRVLQGRSGNEAQQMLPTDEQGLATHLNKVGQLLVDSDVNEAAFTPYEGRIPPNMFGAEAYDDGFSRLDPETYVRIRIGDQLKFYTMRTNQYEKQIRRLQTGMLIFGGIGTFLAAISAQYWLPLTAAVVSSMTAFLEYQQLEQILSKYNVTKASLENIRSNWLALSEAERNDDRKVQQMVRDVEAILESENQGWVQYVNQVQEQQGGKAPEVRAQQRAPGVMVREEPQAEG